MNSQSDLRLGSTMLFVGTLICGGFAVAALYPVVKNTTWRELLSRPAPTTVSAAETPAQPSAGRQPLNQQQAAGAEQKNHQQRLAQKRRLAEQHLLRKRMEQQQAARRAAQTRPASHQRVAGTTTVTATGQRTTRSVPRPMSGGMTRDHASSDALHNEVYVPVNVHPVTVNVDGSAMSGEVARLADGINQVLTAQREALRAQQQTPPAQLQPVIVQAVPQQVLRPAEPDATVSEEEKRRLEKIDSALRELAKAFESLRVETRTAVAGISQDVTHAQASQIEVTSQLLAEYRLAIEQQQQLMRHHQEDVTARIRLESLSASAQAERKEVEERVVVTQKPADVTQPDPVEVKERPVVEVVTAPEPAEEKVPFEQPLVTEASPELRLLRIPEPAAVAEEPEPVFDDEVVEDRVSEFAEFEAFESHDDELESWIAENAADPVEESVVEVADPWDLENPMVETDAEPEFEAWVASHYEPRRMIRDPAAIARAAEQQRVRAFAYEQTYRFPLASAEQSGRQVRHAAGYRENGQPQCRNPHHAHSHVRPQLRQQSSQTQSRPSVQQVSGVAAQSRPPQAQRPRQPNPAGQTQNARPAVPPARASGTQTSQSGDSGIFAELGHNVRHGASQLGIVLAGPNPRLNQSRQDPHQESRFLHRMKSTLRNVSGAGSAQ